MPNLIGLGNGQLELGQQLLAQQQRDAAIQQMIAETGRMIFAQMLVAERAQAFPNGKLNPAVVRHIAQASLGAAPYYAEQLGLVKVTLEDEKPPDAPFDRPLP